MKKILLLMLCLSALCGCVAAPSTAETASTAIDIQLSTDSFHADDGTVLLQVTSPTITLTLADESVAKTICADLSRRVDKKLTSTAELLEYARDEHRIQTDWSPWSCEYRAYCMRLDETMVSVYFEYREFTGGNHPTFSVEAVTYDCKTGQVMNLTDLLAEGHVESELVVLVNEALAQKKDSLYDDYEALVSQAFVNGTLPCWYLSDDGLCFAFAPYAIGPYASGIITATVSYDKLEKILQSGYL